MFGMDIELLTNICIPIEMCFLTYNKVHTCVLPIYTHFQQITDKKSMIFEDLLCSFISYPSTIGPVIFISVHKMMGGWTLHKAGA